ncbi:TetR family transcriptional regulator [Nocardioides sp. dk4132]|uniref:TetR/AcrR family transcriptional regulator n=1 Tax=unclassified Nocardioides TaxID=2615069 RepID=UPI001295EFAE|nr:MULTISPECIES: TetR/AcrR family transcriptional regulator [unclassified Nocardioides]MQW77408.1 TetR family transcriptional regulator [Nocardioides sp. dk4132]QGA09218.1 TetR family transcriptional regulator [Nocardioides sp. dk884]
MIASRGDRRRSALLEALDEHLRDAGPDARLDDINVADLSRRAGVTRSAFYFYFDNKADAVAGLLEEMHDDGLSAAELLAGDGAVRDQVAAAIRTVLSGWERRRHVYRAMLEARATSPGVRERWDSAQEGFVRIAADVIDAERRAGLAPPGPDAHAVATVLLDVNDRALARLVQDAAELDWERHVDAVVHVWLSTIYGRNA